MRARPHLAQFLVPYIPVTLGRKVLAGGLPAPGQVSSLVAATMFSDISGFTAMSEELSTDGPRGAEELNRVLLSTFTGMIDLIHVMGGAISHFYGDAMSVYFPDHDGQAARRALRCGQTMQKLMLTSLGKVSTRRPPDKKAAFDLTIKIGLSYGRCHEVVVGDPSSSLEFVLFGPAVDEAAAAAGQAAAGTIVTAAALRARIDESLPDEGVAPAHRATAPVLDWASADEVTLHRIATEVAPFVPSALVKRAGGEGLEILAEHRPVTSVFVKFKLSPGDPAGSDADAAEEGELLHRYYQWACDMVARFAEPNARVNRVLTGDKGNQLHIIFGAPVAPDAPEQAVRCALALQDERPPFVADQRIGLAVGKVFAGPVGSNTRNEYTVVGDVVNLSSRLLNVCEDRGVVVNESAAGRVRQQINLASLPPVQVKGKRQSVVPYRAQSERTRAGQLQAYFGTWNKPLLGRQNELDLLLGGMDAALHGIGGVAALFGPVGVGKTHLLSEAARYWLEQQGSGLADDCFPHTADTPFGPWRGIWRNFFGLSADMDLAAQAEAVSRQTLALVPDSDPDVGLWGELLGLPLPQDSQLALLTPEARQARFFSLVRRCFQAAAARQPLLIILEGLHWADQASLALIDDLTAHLAEHALFFALAFRPISELPLETLSRPQCMPIVISELPPADARRLLQHHVGVSTLPLLVEQYLGLKDAQGADSPVNPLFLEESLNVMMEMSVLKWDSSEGSATDIRIDEDRLSRMPVPDTIHGLLLARLDRLPATSRDLLQVASVIGREFGLDPLDRITPAVAREIITRCLEELTVAEMTRLVAAAPELVYLFQHTMTHEVAYESLPFARRQDLHRAVALWLTERYRDNLKPLHSILAHHYDQADMHDQALRFALLAADDARDIFANREAVRLYSVAQRHLAALGEESHLDEAVRIYLSRGGVLILLGDIAEAFNDVEKALALSRAHPELKKLAESCNLMAEIKWRQGEYGAAQALAESVFALAQESISNDQLVQAYIWHGWACSSQFEYEPALASLRRAEQICRSDGNNLRLARALEAVSYVYFSKKELEPALDAMQQSLLLSRDHATTFNTGIGLSNISFVQFMLGRAEESLETLEEAVDLGREVSDYLLAVSLGNRAAVLAYLGRFPQALHDLEQAADLLDAMDDLQQRAETYLFWGNRYSNALGDWQDAEYRLEQARQSLDRRPESYPEERVRLLIGLAQVALGKGLPQQAEKLLDEAGTLARENELVWWLPAVSYWLGLARLRRGDRGDARARFRHGLAAVESGGSPDFRPLLLLELARLEPSGERQLSFLEQCVAAARTRASYLDRLRCLEEAGRMLAKYEAPSWRELGQACLAQAEEMAATLEPAPVHWRHDASDLAS